MTNRNHTAARRRTSAGPPRRTTTPTTKPPRSPGKTNRVTSPGTTRSRAPALAPRHFTHRRWWSAVPIAAVVVVVVTFLAIAGPSGTAPRVSTLGVGSVTPSGTAAGTGAVPASAAVQGAVASVGAATLRSVGTPAGLSGPTAIAGTRPPLVGADGKPDILYVGAEYCPFCAAQRWALTVALSRFGVFSGLATTRSSSSDIYPDTPSLSFYGSTYTSPDLDFTPVELATNEAVSGQYPTLQRLTPDQEAVLSTYDKAPYTSQPGAIPFIDIGNRFVMIGASYSPTVLQGHSWAQIGRALSHPSSAIAQAVDGSANLLVTAITRATGIHPVR